MKKEQAYPHSRTDARLSAQVFDCLIIGAGIAGASLAARLAPSLSVAVLEQEPFAGYHATGRSTFTFVESYGNTVIRSLTNLSRPFYEATLGSFQTPVLTNRGNLTIAAQTSADQLQTLFDSARGHITDLQLVDPVTCGKLCPALKVDQISLGLYEPHAADMDVSAIHQAFLKQATQNDASLYLNAKISELSFTDNVWRAETGLQSFEAPIIVNAAGAWASEIAELAHAAVLPIEPRRRSVFLFDAPSEYAINPWPLVRDLPETFYFKPSAGRILATPADEVACLPCDAQPEDLDIAIGVDRIEKTTHLKVSRIARKWAGLRTFAPDKSPVVGWDETAPAFFWLAGQGGYGIQTAPALSQIAASKILQETLPMDLAAIETALEPDRLTNPSFSQEALP